MKTKLFCLLAFLMLSIGIKAQNVSIPDANLKARLLSSSPTNTVAKNLSGNYFKIDANNDGNIQVSEALQVSELNILFYGTDTGLSYTTINSIDGIKSFSALKKLILKIGNSNQYSSSVDLSSMVNLENLDLTLDFTGTQNHDINVSNCTALKLFKASVVDGTSGFNFNGCTILEDVNLNGGTVSNPTIGTINLSNFTSLKSLSIQNINVDNLLLQGCNALQSVILKEYFSNSINNPLNLSNLPNLTTLALNKYNVTLDAHNCPNLISVIGGNITDLNVQDCTSLVDLKTSSFNNTLNVTNCINLKTISGAANCSSIDLSNLQNLDSILFLPLDCAQQQSTLLSSLNVQNCPKLRKITTYELKLTALDVSNLPKLESLQILHCDYSPFSALTLTQINASNCPLLNTFDIKGSYKVQSINLQNCSSLSNIILHNGNAYEGRYAINNINITGCNNFTDLDIRKCSFSTLNLPNLPNLKTIDCSNNFLTNLDFVNLQSLETIICGKNNLATLIVHDLLNLINFDYSDGYLTSIDFQNLPKLKNLIFNNNQLTNLVLNNLPLIEKLECKNNHLVNLALQNLPIKYLDCSNNQLVNLNLQNLPIKYLDCSSNQLVNLVVSNLNDLESLMCAHNQISLLNLTNNLNLGYLDCSYNQLTSLDAEVLKILPTSTYNVGVLNCSHNQLHTLNIEGIHMYSIDFSYNNLISVNLNNISSDFSFNCSNNQLTTLDLSTYYYDPNYSPTLEFFDCSNNALTTMFLKNGITEFGMYPANLSNNPNLKYICCDDTEINKFKSLISQYGYNNCTVNTYCSLNPGGNYNTITGTVRFDENNNGCDINDEVFEHMKIKIDDGITTGETFVKSNGKYDFYTQTGDFIITAEPENASLFTVTPSTFTTNFVGSNNNTFTKNLCVTKNGNIKDLEVVFAPVTDARPGFDAIYKIIWRNKGNTTLSGNATLSFDATKMSLVSSELPSSAIGNLITFNFTNLKPYQNTSSEIIFTINTPTNPTNPVNNGDILNFSTGVNPVLGDANPDDNQFVYKQTVVGSFDPNDITCLEGNLITLSMVGKYLHYIVNFENTGTAPATNIVIEMDINPDDFDINTLQLQNTSHNTYTKVTGNKVEFIIKDINLAATAHGNVALKIKSKNNLVSGDSVINKVNIYFDYNFPVATNEATTNIINSYLATLEIVEGNSAVSVYPNPTKDDVNIESDSKIKSIEVYDIQGRLTQKQLGINSKSAKITIKNNNSGVYLFRINTEKETFTKKVIKN